MIYEETDDMIGLGDFASFLRKARKVGKRVRGVVKRVRSRIKGVRGKAKRAAAVVREEVDQTATAVRPSRSRAPATPGRPTMGPAGSGAAGAMEWVKANPVIVAGAGLAAILLFARKR